MSALLVVEGPWPDDSRAVGLWRAMAKPVNLHDWFGRPGLELSSLLFRQRLPGQRQEQRVQGRLAFVRQLVHPLQI